MTEYSYGYGYKSNLFRFSPLFSNFKWRSGEFPHGLRKGGMQLKDDLCDPRTQVFVVGPSHVQSPLVCIVFIDFFERDGYRSINDWHANSRMGEPSSRRDSHCVLSAILTAVRKRSFRHAS